MTLAHRIATAIHEKFLMRNAEVAAGVVAMHVKEMGL